MLNPKLGEIWLVRFPFSDLTSTKVRPALVLANHRQDVIILGIFSKVPPGIPEKTWVLINDRQSHFTQTGLAKTSILRAEKIATAHQSTFQRKLGTIPKTKAEGAIVQFFLVNLLPAFFSAYSTAFSNYSIAF